MKYIFQLDVISKNKHLGNTNQENINNMLKGNGLEVLYNELLSQRAEDHRLLDQ
jgi:hypothetical protein